MKSKSVALILCFPLISTILSACGSALGPSPETSLVPASAPTVLAVSNQAISTPALDELDVIPLYPGAEQLSQFVNSATIGSVGFAFWTDASPDEVLSYYRTYYDQRDWSLEKEVRQEEFYFSYFLNTDQKGIRRYVSLRIEMRGDKNTGGDVELDRWPDPDKIPLYPNAQETTTRYEMDPVYLVANRIITYNVQASVQEIQSYYNNSLPMYGWLKEGTLETPQPGSAFSYTRGRAQIDYGVQLYTQSLNDKQTQVELHISGTGITMPSPKN
jgi:hypothetical protein